MAAKPSADPAREAKVEADGLSGFAGGASGAPDPFTWHNLSEYDLRCERAFTQVEERLRLADMEIRVRFTFSPGSGAKRRFTILLALIHVEGGQTHHHRGDDWDRPPWWPYDNPCPSGLRSRIVSGTETLVVGDKTPPLCLLATFTQDPSLQLLPTGSDELALATPTRMLLCASLLFAQCLISSVLKRTDAELILHPQDKGADSLLDYYKSTLLHSNVSKRDEKDKGTASAPLAEAIKSCMRPWPHPEGAEQWEEKEEGDGDEGKEHD